MRSEKPLVSIIVPVYNSEPYLEKCIQSLRNQTLKNIEIILVNDASPDNSKAIMEKHANQDERIVTIYNKENGKPKPRNAGILAARGFYLGFVDADDWVSEEMYEKLYQATTNESIDVVAADVNRHFSSGKVEKEINIDNSAFESSDSVKSYVSQYGGRLFANIWKRNLITNDLLFEGTYLYSDSIVFLWYMKAASFAKVNEALYQYNINENSISHYKDNYRFFDRCKSAMAMFERAKKIGLYDEYQEEIDFGFYRLYCRNTLFLITCAFSKTPKKEIREIKDNFDRLVKIKNNRYYTFHKKEKLNTPFRIIDYNFSIGLFYMRCMTFYHRLASAIGLRTRIKKLLSFIR